jgi:hypothetical protein
VEGVGIFRAGHTSLQWPGNDAAIPGLLAVGVLLSRAFISALRPPSAPTQQSHHPDSTAREVRA